MATLLLSAAGAAFGGSLGGSFAGLATGVIGKAVGASIGATIDQRLAGLGSEPVEAGRVERFRVMGAAEGSPIPRIFGRYRTAGQVIWSSRFREESDTSRVGGKGTSRGGAEVREYSYSISLALALCEGSVYRIGRVWADGQRLDLSSLEWRLHAGGEDQAPDPLISAIEGEDEAPAYRGTAYVVFENLPLGQFGNRIPQFNFEVFRRPQTSNDTAIRSPAPRIRGVALIPGTGEYSLATEPVNLRFDKVNSVVTNVHNDRGEPDLLVSLEQKRAELPRARSVSLVVSWFGDDLRCGRCTLRPKVEQTRIDGAEMAWRVSGLPRAAAAAVGKVEGRPVFGGTPADASVVQAIRHMRGEGERVMFYPFILMDILEGNALPDPWMRAPEQPRVPWRGRITSSIAPGLTGTPDRTPAAAAEVAAFFGNAELVDFEIDGSEVRYIGAQEWSYRRFILHYAHLCKAAGGVDAFCIGSEMRSLTQLRSDRVSYPAVTELRRLAQDVRRVLGKNVKIGYAADWSEYFGHHPADGSGDVNFHLDPLWSHADIDFVGIDNYMPLSDWRDGSEHADAAFGSQYDKKYLKSGVMGGEGYHWYYASPKNREEQRRTDITDGDFDEPWVFRYKDLVNWWSRPHHDRRNGVRAVAATAWMPGSKPIWFTEIGCPAVDKGTNQPNVFVDPKSSESFLPYFSTGEQDDCVQQAYLNAILDFWAESENNPVSSVYAGRMLDLDNVYVWAWDARPWPDFPDRREAWSDGGNYFLGHWLNARAASPTLSEICGEILESAGCHDADLSEAHGVVQGYVIGSIESARQSLQPLSSCYALSIRGRGPTIEVRRADMGRILELDALELALSEEPLDLRRDNAEDRVGTVCIDYVDGSQDYALARGDFRAPGENSLSVSTSSLPIVLSEAQAIAVAQRWFGEALVARDTLQFAVPLSRQDVSIGSLVTFADMFEGRAFRIDRIEDSSVRQCSAVRVESSVYSSSVIIRRASAIRRSPARSQVYAEVLDIPHLTVDDLRVGPYVAVGQEPWRGDVAVYAASPGERPTEAMIVRRPSVFAEFEDDVPAAVPGVPIRRSFVVKVSGDAGMANLLDRNPSETAIAVHCAELGQWEVLTFEAAEAVSERRVALRSLVRGQFGTEVPASRSIRAGSSLVVPSIANARLDLDEGLLGEEITFHVGPAKRSYADRTFIRLGSRFSGVALRPYSPCHLRAERTLDGAVEVAWSRRSRRPEALWTVSEPAQTDEPEQYLVEIFVAGSLKERLILSEPLLRLAPATLGWVRPMSLRISVCQISLTVGYGPKKTIDLFELNQDIFPIRTK